MAEKHAPPAPTTGGWQSAVKTRTGPIAIVGYLALAVFVGGFASWGLTAPLSSSTIAPGIVVAPGENVMIQHLEGGILKTVVQHEGDRVHAGDPLLILDSTVAEAQLDRLLQQLIAQRAEMTKLEAERDGATTLTMPAELANFPAALNATGVFDEERKEFEAQMARFTSEEDILDQRVTALDQSIDGLKAQKAATQAQIDIVQTEAARKKDALDKLLATRDEYTALLRAGAELVGEAGSLEAQMAGTVSQLEEAKDQIERLKTQRVEDAVTQLNKDRELVADLEQQVRAAQAVLDRTTLRAPVDGIIVHSVYNSPGNVVRPGEVVMELLPTGGDLIVEAHVRPQDIDTIKPNQTAQLMFTAFNTRTTPKIEGKVYYISADHLVTSDNSAAYYVVRLKIDQDLPPGITRDEIYPGMPVETFISTGDRTFASYLIRPLGDSMSRAFREQ